MEAAGLRGFDLSPEDWTTLRRLLEEALAQPAAARTGWLARLPAGQARFAPRLSSLLSHAGASSLPLDALPAIETAQFAPAPSADAEHAAGERVGPYRLVRILGEGGMGSVWLAERDDMLQRRPVALKLPRLVTGRAQLAERLAREREILATIEHPNVARLYEAGLTADGQPWLALEYVEGERIDTWCEGKALDVPDRLHLFLQVARAVSHAHARLVVHRDLKPANILVTAAGQVRLLDFGIAKLLDGGHAHETELTHLGGRALTPEYAAPEQILGQPIGTAADVYALGVVLFELLTGTRPYRLKRHSRAALEEAIVQAQVQRPSSVAGTARRQRQLRGDLDTIVLKALKRAPGERYGTVEALADDIERHLDQRPVRAQPDTLGYRLRKFVARNRLAVGATGAASLALLGATGVAIWQAREALSQQRRADVEMHIARKSERIANAQATLADFMASDPALRRSAADIESQIERSAALVRSNYAGDALVRAHLLASLAGRYRRSGDFGRWRALAAEAESAAREAGDTELMARLACQRSRDDAQSGRLAQARSEVAAQIAALDALDPMPNATLVGCLADASAIARLSGDARAAITSAQRIRDIEVRAGMEGSINHTDTLMILARAYAMAGRYQEAVASTQAGLAIHARAGSDGTPGANNLRTVQATLLRDGGQPLVASKALDALLSAHRTHGGSGAAAASLDYEQALSLLRAGRAADAVPALARSAAVALQRDDRTLLRAATIGHALALAATGQTGEARRVLADAAALYAALLAEQAYPTRLFLLARAEVDLAAGDPAAAQQSLEAAERILRRADNGADPTWRQLDMLRAGAALASGQPAQALQHAESALRRARQQAVDPQASLHVGMALLLSAQARAAAGDRAGAAGDATAALRHLEATADAAHAGLATARAFARL